MKKVSLVLLLVLSVLTPATSAHSAELCSSLSTPLVADDGLTVTMNSMVVTEKPGSYQLTISYTQRNATADKKIDEGSFKIFFSDGTSEPQYGGFGSFFPSDSRQRSYTWEYLKAKTPIAVEYNAGFFTAKYDTNKLNWAIPGQPCTLTASAPAVNWDGKVRFDKEIDWKLCVSSAQILGQTPNCGLEPDAAKKPSAEKPQVTGGSQASADSAFQAMLVVVNEIDGIIAKTSAKYPVMKGNLSKFNNSRPKYPSSLTSDLTAESIEKITSALGAFKTNLISFIESQSKNYPKTITCVKGSTSKKVTAMKPVCPKGFKQLA